MSESKVDGDEIWFERRSVFSTVLGDEPPGGVRYSRSEHREELVDTTLS